MRAPEAAAFVAPLGFSESARPSLRAVTASSTLALGRARERHFAKEIHGEIFASMVLF
jgi:hypothetical protein